jgi:hypothetical protein
MAIFSDNNARHLSLFVFLLDFLDFFIGDFLDFLEFFIGEGDFLERLVDFFTRNLITGEDDILSLSFLFYYIFYIK